MIIRKLQTIHILAILFALSLSSNTALAAKAMPPSFKFAPDFAEVLRTYPLGVLKEQDVFSHHGGPVQKIVLPNGNKAWLYKSGEEEGIPDLYVLEFSRDGIVIDVLHKISITRKGTLPCNTSILLMRM